MTSHYQHYDRSTIQEVPIRVPVAPIIDADEEQKQRFRLRDLK